MSDCCVQNCHRRAKSHSEFCERCWLQLTDEERVGYQVAMHAPFFTRWLDVADFKGVALPANHSIEFAPYDKRQQYGEYSAYGLPFLKVIREYEQRTTRDAIAQALWDRQWAAKINDARLAEGAPND